MATRWICVVYTVPLEAIFRELQARHVNPLRAPGEYQVRVLRQVEVLENRQTAVPNILNRNYDLRPGMVAAMAFCDPDDMAHPNVWWHQQFSTALQVGKQEWMPKLAKGQIVHTPSYQRDGFVLHLELDGATGKVYRYRICLFADEAEQIYFSSTGVPPPEEMILKKRYSNNIGGTEDWGQDDRWNGKPRGVFVPFRFWKNYHGRDRPFLAVAITEDGVRWRYFPVEVMPEPRILQSSDTVVSEARRDCEEKLQEFNERVSKFGEVLPQQPGAALEREVAVLAKAKDGAQGGVDNLRGLIESESPETEAQRIIWLSGNRKKVGEPGYILGLDQIEGQLNALLEQYRVHVLRYHYRRKVEELYWEEIKIAGVQGRFRDTVAQLALTNGFEERHPLLQVLEQDDSAVSEAGVNERSPVWNTFEQEIRGEVLRIKEQELSTLIWGKVTLKGIAVSGASVTIRNAQGGTIEQSSTDAEGEYEVSITLLKAPSKQVYTVAVGYVDAAHNLQYAKEKQVSVDLTNYTEDMEVSFEFSGGDSTRTGTGAPAGAAGAEQQVKAIEAISAALVRGIIHFEKEEDFSKQIEELRAAEALLDPGKPFAMGDEAKKLLEELSAGRIGIKHEEMNKLGSQVRDSLKGFADHLNAIAGQLKSIRESAEASSDPRKDETLQKCISMNNTLLSIDNSRKAAVASLKGAGATATNIPALQQALAAALEHPQGDARKILKEFTDALESFYHQLHQAAVMLNQVTRHAATLEGELKDFESSSS